jgi:hypothetical protein
MSADRPGRQGTLSNPLVALSVSNSPDLGRLGLLKRGLDQTVSALATGLVCLGARVVYGGNLDKSGFTYLLYPMIAQAYATAATRASRPRFVHYVSAYLAQDNAELVAHLKAVGSFAEIRLVNCDREVTSIIMSGNELVCRSPQGERRLPNVPDLQAFVADLPRRSAGPPADLDAMREAMENDVSARIVLGGAVAGYSGSKPGILQETLLALQKGHPVYLLGGFGGAARDAAIALGLLQANDALAHDKVGPGYQESIEAIGAFADRYRSAAQAAGNWDDLVAASKAEDPEQAAKCVMRALPGVISK